MQDREKIEAFLKYCIIGVIAFVCDAGTICIMQEFFVSNNLYISTSIGFVMGLTVNYILSSKYLFKSKMTGKKYVGTGIIGVVGLGITEIGMHIGTDKLKLHYVFVKCVVAVIVLLWNYWGRVYLVFARRD